MFSSRLWSLIIVCWHHNEETLIITLIHKPNGKKTPVLSRLSLDTEKSNVFIFSCIHLQLRNYARGIHNKIMQILFCPLPRTEETLPALDFHSLLCKELGKMLSKPGEESYCSGRVWCIKFQKACHILLELMHCEILELGWENSVHIFSNPTHHSKACIHEKSSIPERWRIRGWGTVRCWFWGRPRLRWSNLYKPGPSGSMRSTRGWSFAWTRSKRAFIKMPVRQFGMVSVWGQPTRRVEKDTKVKEPWRQAAGFLGRWPVSVTSVSEVTLRTPHGHFIPLSGWQ